MPDVSASVPSSPPRRAGRAQHIAEGWGAGCGLGMGRQLRGETPAQGWGAAGRKRKELEKHGGGDGGMSQRRKRRSRQSRRLRKLGLGEKGGLGGLPPLSPTKKHREELPGGCGARGERKRQRQLHNIWQWRGPPGPRGGRARGG